MSQQDFKWHSKRRTVKIKGLFFCNLFFNKIEETFNISEIGKDENKIEITDKFILIGTLYACLNNKISYKYTLKIWFY